MTDTNTVTPVVATTEPVTTVKPGYSTTEFWLVLLFNVVSMIIASGAIHSSVVIQVAALIVSALSSMGYTKFRSDLKK
jgi:hypothetical protein